MNQEEKELNSEVFDFCTKDKRDFNQELICSQQKVSKTLKESPIEFIIFYLVTVLFIAFLFQLTKKDFSNKDKKNK